MYSVSEIISVVARINERYRRIPDYISRLGDVNGDDCLAKNTREPDKRYLNSLIFNQNLNQGHRYRWNLKASMFRPRNCYLLFVLQASAII